MREAQFLKQNADKWQQYEAEIKNGNVSVDLLADHFIELTDDLAYARTFYPKSNTIKYLNGIAALFHQKIYRNKKEKSSRVWWFWQFELPYLFKKYQKQFLHAFLFFILFLLIGLLSAKYDENFVRLILGDNYVNMTTENIAKGNPFGVYSENNGTVMFFMIAFNNIRVAFVSYVLGVTFCIGPLWLLLNNGIMLGAFEYFLFSKGVGIRSITIVFIHGTLEIWAFVIAGAAGLILSNGILFPGTYSRQVSFLRAGKDGLKIIIGLVPVFLTAAFFESFVTRYSAMPMWLNASILTCSLIFIIWYFILYPIRLHKRIEKQKNNIEEAKSKNFNAWISNKFS
jgi:uncharacterized membrane protein SpoIIM required for sporulation